MIFFNFVAWKWAPNVDIEHRVLKLGLRQEFYIKGSWRLFSPTLIRSALTNPTPKNAITKSA
jgi:hypothetical protein